jgi:hypothetical protein
LSPGTDENNLERVVEAEILQQKHEQTVAVFHFQVLEKITSQYCVHHLVAGVVRYLRFRRPLLVDHAECRKAKNKGGNIVIMGHLYEAKVGTMTSHSRSVAGGLDDEHNCEQGTPALRSWEQFLKFQV